MAVAVLVGAALLGVAVATAAGTSMPAAQLGLRVGTADALPSPPGTTERVSLGADGRQGNAASGGVSEIFEAMNPDQAMSGDGRWVVFASTATNLIPGEDHPNGGIFVRDRQSGTTFAVPWVGGGPFPATALGAEPVVAGDGSVVAFTVLLSSARSGAFLAPSTAPYVLAWDRATNLTEVVSVDAAGTPIPGYQPSISADGRYVAYTQWFVDTTPPVLSNLTANPTRIGGCSGPNSTTISVTATDAGGEVTSVTLYYTPSGGSTLSQAMSSVGSNVWRSTIVRDPAWSHGQITYRVQAVDSSGNVSPVLFPISSNELFHDPCFL